MKQSLLILLATAELMLGAGCSKIDSSDLNSDVPLYQSYQVTYYKSTNSTACAAFYRVRTLTGTRVELGNGSSVKMNGLSPSTSPIDRTLYEWDGPGFFDASFVLTKNNGRTITNVVRRSDINDIDFASLPDTVSKSAGFSFNWTGVALGANEQVVVELSTTDNQANPGGVSGNTVHVSASDLAGFMPGKLTVQLNRMKTMTVQAADSGASGATYIYYNNSKDIVLVP